MPNVITLQLAPRVHAYAYAWVSAGCRALRSAVYGGWCGTVGMRDVDVRACVTTETACEVSGLARVLRRARARVSGEVGYGDLWRLCAELALRVCQRESWMETLSHGALSRGVAWAVGRVGCTMYSVGLQL